MPKMRPIGIKGKCLIKRGIAKLGDEIIFVKIRGYGDNSVINEASKLKMLENIPKKTKLANSAEREQIKLECPELSFDNNTVIRITDIDRTSPVYLKMEEDITGLIWAISVINFFDFDYVDEAGNTYWTESGIEKGNYLEFAKLIRDELQPSKEDIESFLGEVEKIKRGEKTLAQMEIDVDEQKAIVDKLQIEMENNSDEVEGEVVEETKPRSKKSKS